MKKKIILIVLLSFIFSLGLAVAIPFTVLAVRTNSLNKDYAYLRNDENYNKKVEIDGISLVKQEISCGYATIEMMSTYYGNPVSENDLSDKHNGAISTSSTEGFYKEINDSIKNHTFVKHSYLKNDVFLKEIYDSLTKSNPVAIEWAAKYEEEWTLHFSLVSGMDLGNNNVTIYNPYGYIENIKVEEFLDRTSFKAYKNIPLFLKFGFAFGAFDKNTLFYANN